MFDHLFWHHCGGRSFALLPPQCGVIEAWGLICAKCGDLISVEPKDIQAVMAGKWS